MFITFEGIDGSGKTTIAEELRKKMSKGKRVVFTREPGDWDGGEVLRTLVVENKLEHPWSEVLLFLLDRAEHTTKVICKALIEGNDVICERYHDSTLAYQVSRESNKESNGFDDKIFKSLCIALKFPIPDLTILFDLAPDKAFERLQERGNVDDFELKLKDSMEKVRRGYKEMAERDPERWEIIDASQPIEDVLKEVCKVLEQRGFEFDL
jgi:dTMP kinase